MFLTDDTICAVSTAAGSGAIAIIRLSGIDTFKICESIIRIKQKSAKFSELDRNTVHLAQFHHNNEPLDEIMVSIFRAPHSYTGEDTVEISCHGSSYIQQKILETLIAQGARLAQPGEFTRRAFLNGKMDLSQAEAVADLIASFCISCRAFFFLFL